MKKNNFDLKKALSVGAVIIALCVVFFAGKIDVKLDQTSLTIKATMMPSKIISYNDIQAVSLSNSWENAERRLGIETVKIRAGVFSNEKGEECSLYAYKNIKELVVLELKDKSVVCFNLSTGKATEDLFAALLSKIARI